MRTKRLVAGLAIAAAGLVLTGCGWEGMAENRFSDDETIGQKITEVRFANDSGDVTIRVGDTTSVHRDVKYDSDKPGKTYRVDGDTLVLEACQARNCYVSYEVVVPEGTTVNGSVESGSAEVTGVASANLEAQSGSLTARDVSGAVNASAESGSVRLAGIGGDVVASAESGNVTVELASPADVSANAESGDIEVTVPRGSYQVRATTDSGEVDNGLTGGDTSGPRLDLVADSGDIVLKEA